MEIIEILQQAPLVPKVAWVLAIVAAIGLGVTLLMIATEYHDDD